MTLINLRGLELELGGYGPLDYAEGTVTYVDAKGAAVAVAGDAVRFPGPVTFTIFQGSTSAAVDLPATTPGVAALWVVRKSDYEQTRQEFRRLTAIPAVGPVDIGSLVEVDRKTLGPLTGGTAAWQVFLDEVEGYRDDAAAAEVAAAADAASANASKEAAKTSETNAKTSENNSKTSEVNAAGSATAANSSKIAAGNSEANAKTSETNAAGSATAANASKVAAGTSEANAKTSETNSKTSETNAKTSETNAAASANVASAGQFSGADLGTADLNTIQTPGIYRSQTSTNATLARNYPADSLGGLLEVFSTSTNVILQRFTITHGAGGVPTRSVYVRRLFGGSWDAWRVLPTQRINQPVNDPGVEAYSWDDKNGNEFGVMPIKNIPNTVDINNLKSTGVWRQANGGLLANNYPIDNFYGVIQVLSRTISGNGGSTQIAYKHNGLSVDSRRYWMRSETSGGWGSWNLYSSTKLNVVSGQPGNEFSLYDDSSNVDRQLALVAIPLVTADLNSITVTGSYLQTTPTNATLARNYPSGTSAQWLLEVYQIASNVIVQRATAGNGLGASAARGYWTRRLNGTVWDAWAFVSTRRIDESAGRVIYDWDYINNREQLVYGDTGWRNITTSVVNGWSANNLSIRRVGHRVTLVAEGLTGAAATAQLAIALPSGFSGSGLPVSPRGLFHSATYPSAVYRAFIGGVLELQFPGWTTAMPTVFGEMSWYTSDAWPTSLPGSASGTIPSV